jgi:antitoxin PrlF
LEQQAHEKRPSGTVRERGQITIPKEVRERAQLEEGAEVDFEVLEPGEIVMRRKITFDTLELDDEFVRSVIASTTEGFEALRNDEVAWASELEERAVLEGSIGDGLDED